MRPSIRPKASLSPHPNPTIHSEVILRYPTLFRLGTIYHHIPFQLFSYSNSRIKMVAIKNILLAVTAFAVTVYTAPSFRF